MNVPRSLGEMPRRPRIFVYGDPGVGKTPLATSAPRTIVLNADGGDALESAREQSKNFKVIDVEGHDDLWEFYRWMKVRLDKGQQPADWVWLDSITLFQDLGMDELMVEAVKRNQNRDPFIPDKPEYQKNQNRLHSWVRHMTRLDVGFGMTAHTMRVVETNEDDEEVTIYMPSVQGGQGTLSSKLCARMSIIGRLYIVEKEVNGKKVARRMMQTRRRGAYYARDRYNALGGSVTNPTVPKIVEAIEARRSA